MSNPSTGEAPSAVVADADTGALTVPVEAIREELERVLHSETFHRTIRLKNFLRFAVEHAIRGEEDHLSEYLIGREVFEKPEGYDPRIDPLVRVEAGRLRSKLRDYYDTEGRRDAVKIGFRKRSYRPCFQIRDLMAVHGSSPTASIRSFAQSARPSESALERPESGDQLTDPQPSILVLPFFDLSPKADQGYVCDGLTVAIINKLARVEGLSVVARTSAFQFRGAAQDIRQIGEKLKVGSILEGSVRKEGGRLRITVQLVNAADGYLIWTDEFERPLTDLFAVQDEIARAVVEVLRVRLGDGEAARSRIDQRPDSIRLHTLYLKGLHHWSRRSEKELKTAISFFQRVVAKEPAHGPAFAGLANCYVSLGIASAVAPDEVMPQAKAAALRALELDLGLPEAHACLAFVRAMYDRDWPAAERGFRLATRNAPRSPTVDHFYAIAYLMPMTRLDEAMSRIRLAQELDPLSVIINTHVGVLYYMKREYDRAIEQFEMALELDPDFYRTYWDLGRAYTQKSMFEEAVAAFDKARNLGGHSSFRLGSLGYCLGSCGKSDEAMNLLAELQELSKRGYVSAYDVAETYLGLGERDQVFEWLGKAYADRGPWLTRLKVDPVFDSVREDPRFGALVQKMGLTS